MSTDAGERWRQMLAAWAIPAEILAQATDDPWECPAELFKPQPGLALTPSHRVAREALHPPGVVLDVGAGGGAMSAPLRDLATRMIAVDQSPAMLEMCDADDRIRGRWPDVAGQVAGADVAVCGHVVYNVPDLEDFLVALNASARRRVVVELTAGHPRGSTWERALWRAFWKLERPTTPTYEDALAVAGAIGIYPRVERWESRPRGFRRLDDLVTAARRRVCLPPDRQADVRAALTKAVEVDGGWLFTATSSAVVTLSWDSPRQ